MFLRWVAEILDRYELNYLLVVSRWISPIKVVRGEVEKSSFVRRVNFYSKFVSFVSRLLIIFQQVSNRQRLLEC